MRDALHGLTTRGRCFLAAALAATLAAMVLGESDLLRVAVLLAALPMLAVWYVGRARYRLSCVRTLEPRRVPVGTTSRVLLRLRNLSRLPTGTLMLEDKLPYALGSRPRLVLERLDAHCSSSVGYTVRADVRGRYTVGPLLVRLTDPFGLCELLRAFPSVDRLTVVPTVLPLPQVRLQGDHGGSGHSRARSVAVHGEDDTATREYRHGDDLRRVHWRSTARTGELMVRREEQPWETQATLLLDCRTSAHRGEGPASSFEWAVTAAASIAAHLRQNRYALRLATGIGADITARRDADSIDQIMDSLAEVRTSHRTTVAKLIGQVRRSRGPGVVIGIFGLLTPGEAQVLAAVNAPGTTCLALLLDSTTWTALDPDARQRAEQDRETSVAALTAAGWRVLPVAHAAALPEVWGQLAQVLQGYAWRATLAETVPGVNR